MERILSTLFALLGLVALVSTAAQASAPTESAIRQDVSRIDDESLRAAPGPIPWHELRHRGRPLAGSNPFRQSEGGTMALRPTFRNVVADLPKARRAAAMVRGVSSLAAPIPRAVRVAIVAERDLSRSGLRKVLEARPEVMVVGESRCDDAARKLVAEEGPEVVLVDPETREEAGIDLIRDLAAKVPSARILLLIEADRTHLQRRAMRSGASGLVSKSTSVEGLVEAIERVRSGSTWFDQHLIAHLFSAGANEASAAAPTRERRDIEALSKREQEVIALVCQGLRNEEIARRLFIAEPTVRHHLTSIFAKLRLVGRSSLVAFAYSHDLANRRGDGRPS